MKRNSFLAALVIAWACLVYGCQAPSFPLAEQREQYLLKNKLCSVVLGTAFCSKNVRVLAENRPIFEGLVTCGPGSSFAKSLAIPSDVQTLLRIEVDGLSIERRFLMRNGREVVVELQAGEIRLEQRRIPTIFD